MPISRDRQDSFCAKSEVHKYGAVARSCSKQAHLAAPKRRIHAHLRPFRDRNRQSGFQVVSELLPTFEEISFDKAVTIAWSALLSGTRTNSTSSSGGKISWGISFSPAGAMLLGCTRMPRSHVAYAAETWERRLEAERQSEVWKREKCDVIEVPGLTQRSEDILKQAEGLREASGHARREEGARGGGEDRQGT